MKPRVSLMAAVAGLCVAGGTLSGCAELMLVNSLAGVATALPPSAARRIETNRLQFAYPPQVVYATVVKGVEQHGRKVVEADAEGLFVRVTYPFSWRQNLWGGTLLISCVASDEGTTVTIVGDGRDALVRVREIGNEVLDEVSTALRRQPRTL